MIEALGEPADGLFGLAFIGGGADLEGIGPFLDAADGDIGGGGHLVAHEVLENHANLLPETLEIVFAQVASIEKDLTFGGIVQAGEQLDDGGFALAVFFDDGDALGRSEFEI